MKTYNAEGSHLEFIVSRGVTAGAVLLQIVVLFVFTLCGLGREPAPAAENAVAPAGNADEVDEEEKKNAPVVEIFAPGQQLPQPRQQQQRRRRGKRDLGLDDKRRHFSRCDQFTNSVLLLLLWSFTALARAGMEAAWCFEVARPAPPRPAPASGPRP
jgi:hypothetical protein